jgi:hypothetical protein
MTNWIFVVGRRGRNDCFAWRPAAILREGCEPRNNRKEKEKKEKYEQTKETIQSNGARCDGRDGDATPFDIDRLGRELPLCIHLGWIWL